MTQDRTVTGNEAQFNEKVIFLKDIEVAGTIKGQFEQDIDTDLLSATDLNISGNSNLYNLNVTGLGTFTKRLDVGIGGTLFTAINSDNGVPNHQGRVGIGTTQPDGLFQVGNKCLTIVVDPCRVGIATTQPDARLQVGAGFTSFNVTSDGNVGIGSTQPSAKFQLGLGNTSVSITGFGSVGLGITDPLSTFHLKGNNSDVSIISGLSTNTLRVGIGTTMPWSTPLTSSQRQDAGGVNLINDSTHGPLRLSIDGSIAISKNIYDSAGSPGGNNWWLRRDEYGIRWVAVEPERSDGIYIQDEGIYIPSAGAAASFSTLNFVQVNSLGIGTDTLVPTVGAGLKEFTGDISNGSPIITNINGEIPAVDDIIDIVSGNQNVTLAGGVKVQSVDSETQVTLDTSFGGSGSATGVSFVGNPNEYGAAGLSTIFTNDLWGFSGTGDEASIYRMTKVGVKNNAPDRDLDITGTLRATLAVDFDSTLDVDGKVTFNNDADSNGPSDSSSLQVDGGVGIVKNLYVGEKIVAQGNYTSTSIDTGALIVENGGAGIEENLYVGGLGRILSSQTSEASDEGALVVTGGVGIQENLYVKELVRFEKDLTSANSSGGALVVTGGVGIGEKLNVADITRVEKDTQSTSLTSGALQVAGGTGIGKNLNVGGGVSITGPADPTGIAVTLASAGGITTTGGDLSVKGLGRVFSNQTSTDSGTGALVVTGGVGIGEKLNVKDITKIESSQQSESTASGALQVEGGVGIKGNVYVGDNVDIADNLKVSKTSEFVGFATFGDDIGVAGVSTFVGFATFIDDVGIGKTLWLNSYVRDINSDTGFSEEVGVCKTDYRLASVGTGVSWRPSGVQTKRTIWVTKNGCDSNSGLLEGDAKATIGGAAAIAEETDTIKIRPGVYIENNPIGLRTDVSITGEDLRLVTVIPDNPGKDVFHVRNGCLVENLNFAGKTETDPQTGLPKNPIETDHSGGGAVAFPPSEQAVNDGKDYQAASGYTEFGPFRVLGEKRYKSPYVRNCTNFMTKSIGMKINGDYATADTFGQDLKSMVCDSFTQYNEAGIGVSLTNNAYAQLVSIFTINADIGIYADTGGQCDLTNSNSSFGNFGLVAVGLGSTQFTGKVHNVNPAGAVVGSTSAENQDTVVCKEVFEKDTNIPRRPFDGQALFFKINLDNYPDVQGNGILEEPLQQLESIKLRSGVDLSGFSAIDPPSVIIRDADGIQEPKGPQGIIAEATATVNAKGILTEIDVIAQGRNYLPTQNIEVSIEGNTGLADAVMKPIYYTVDSATDRTESGPSAGICTITFNEFIPYELFPDDEFSLQRISRILTSSHSFEYIGSGTDINKSTPLQGAIPIKENEIVASDGAQIPFTSTDQKGNFDIGEGIQIDQTTSTIRGRDFSRAIQAEVTPLILALR